MDDKPLTPRGAPPGEASPPEARPAAQPEAHGPGLVLVGVGTMFAAMILSGFLLGYWTDVWLDTKPLFMLTFGGLGLVGGILKVHRLLT